MGLIGQILSKPLEGYNRYTAENTSMWEHGSAIRRIESLTVTNPDGTTFGGGCAYTKNSLSMRFRGTGCMLGFIYAPDGGANANFVSAEEINIYLDGVLYDKVIFDNVGLKLPFVGFAVNNLNNGDHDIKIECEIRERGVVFAYIDVKDGWLVHPVLPTKTRVEDMQVGDAIPATFVGCNGSSLSMDSIGDLSKTVHHRNRLWDTDLRNGDTHFTWLIKVNEGLLLPDRNIYTNTTGIDEVVDGYSSGKKTFQANGYRFNARLISGGNGFKMYEFPKKELNLLQEVSSVYNDTTKTISVSGIMYTTRVPNIIASTNLSDANWGLVMDYLLAGVHDNRYRTAETISIDFGKAVEVKCYATVGENASTAVSCNGMFNFYLEGSNDGISWDLLDVQRGLYTTDNRLRYCIPKRTGKYSKYRFRTTDGYNTALHEYIAKAYFWDEPPVTKGISYTEYNSWGVVDSEFDDIIVDNSLWLALGLDPYKLFNVHTHQFITTSPFFLDTGAVNRRGILYANAGVNASAKETYIFRGLYGYDVVAGGGGFYISGALTGIPASQVHRMALILSPQTTPVIE